MSRLSKSAMRRFVADFAERLYQRNRNPLHLFVDEADAFVPQKPQPDQMRMLGAIDDIVRRGRIRGLGCTLVTQRSAVLNKDVLTQTEVLLVLRTAHPRDRAPVLEWMKVHATPEQLAAVTESLAKLGQGDAWVMSAGWLDLFARVQVRKGRTFDSSATPKVGQRRIVPRRLAPVDLAVLQKRMAETIEKAKAEDPKALRAEIARLTKALDAKVPTVTRLTDRSQRFVKTVTRDRPVVTTADVARIEKAVASVTKGAADLASKLDTLEHRLLRPLHAELAQIKLVAVEKLGRHMTMAAEHTPAPRVDPPKNPARPVPAAGGAGNGDSAASIMLPAGAHRMLQQLAIWHPRALARAELAVLSGVGTHGGAFRTYLSKLRVCGLLRERDGLVYAAEVLFMAG